MKNKNAKKNSKSIPENLRLDPKERLCPMYNSMSIKDFDLPDPKEMGFRVIDNYAEENQR